nr:hypothetical protein CFP56_73247 [Quercus suber]
MVEIDISKPMCRGRKITVCNGQEWWISFKYESLPNICYWCGKLTHFDRECPTWLKSRTPKEGDKFGPWLRAFVPNPSRKMVIPVLGFDEDDNGDKGFELPMIRDTLLPTENHIPTITEQLANIDFGITRFEVTKGRARVAKNRSKQLGSTSEVDNGGLSKEAKVTVLAKRIRREVDEEFDNIVEGKKRIGADKKVLTVKVGV